MKSLINESRYVPSFMNAHRENESGSAEVFYTTTASANGKFLAIAYSGKRKAKDWFYYFKTEERMLDAIEKHFTDIKVREDNNIVRKRDQKAKDDSVTCKVGDIFHYSWGYDQTNCEFFQVVAFKGKTATLRNIGSKSVPGSSGFMCEHVIPVKDAFITGNMAETITKRIKSNYNGDPSFSMDFGSLTLTTENSSHYSSWYA